MDSSQNINLGEAASRFVVSLSRGKIEGSQPVIYRFVRWFGRERPIAGLVAHEIANYAQRLSSSGTDYSKNLDIIRAFLAYVRNEGWIKSNLAAHLKAKKGKSRLTAGMKQASPQPVSLTRQGYNEIKKELVALKSRRLQTISEVSRAAADKDFRENAPLDAAREQLSHLVAKIKESEEALRSATVIDEKVEATPRVAIGNSIVLTDLASGEEVRYTIVSPREVDPARGRISSASPMGRAVIGRGCQDIIEITAPAGRLRYRIERIGR